MHDQPAGFSRMLDRRSTMRRIAPLTAAFILASLAGFAQNTHPKPELLLFHPSGPPLSYEVATIKPIDPETAGSMVSFHRASSSVRSASAATS